MIQTVREKAADGNVLAFDGTSAPENVIPSHELSWQLWQQQVTADGADVSNLKILVAESVQGVGAQQTIKTAVGKLAFPILTFHQRNTQLTLITRKHWTIRKRRYLPSNAW